MIDVVQRVAETIFIPFSVGGGIRNLEDMRKVILAGAEKVSVNSAAVNEPEIIAQVQGVWQSVHCAGMDVKKVMYPAKSFELRNSNSRREKIYRIDALWWQRRLKRLAPVNLSEFY